MIGEVFPYFVREMVKLSKKESEDAQQKRMIKGFAILGATSAPLVSGVLNSIEKGEFVGDRNPFRWMASRIAGGLIGGAIFPTVRRHIAMKPQRKKS